VLGPSLAPDVNREMGMKRNSVSLALACTIVLLLGSASLSQAETIVITSGLLQMDGTEGSLELAGNRGFTLFSPLSGEEGIFVPGQQCTPDSQACPPGYTLSLAANWVGSAFLGGTATLDGQSYSLGIDVTDAAAFVDFTGSVVLPPLAGQSAFVSAPFRFSGLFHYPDSVPLPSETLTGRGTATLALVPSEEFPGHWAYSSARYEFAPVPEPGTMLLVSGGLAALAARARKRRKTGGSTVQRVIR
jgi:PEP-CTERM motif